MTGQARGGYAVRLLGAAALAVVVAPAVGLMTLTNVVARSQPELPTRWASDDAGTRAARSLTLLAADSSVAGRRQASALATAALDRSPLEIDALRTLAAAAAAGGNAARARRVFLYAQRLSRRDVGTQLWLLEDAVGRGEIDEALAHYDNVLRVSPAMYDTLFPIMRAAAASSQVASGLAHMLAARPPWWPFFIGSMVDDPATPPNSIAPLFAAVKLRVGVPDEREKLGGGMGRLVAAGRFDEAYSLLRAAHAPRPTPSQHVYDGGFEHGDGVAPFGWALTHNDGYDATPDVGPSGGRVLRLTAASGNADPIARQLVVTSPGSYSLSLRAGQVGADAATRPLITLSCADDGRLLASFRPVAAGDDGARTAVRVQVPAAGCAMQWLTFSKGPDGEGASGATWIDDVALEPITR